MWSEKNDFSLSINQSDEITQGAITIFLIANKLTCTEMEEKSHVPQCASDTYTTRNGIFATGE